MAKGEYSHGSGTQRRALISLRAVTVVFALALIATLTPFGVAQAQVTIDFNPALIELEVGETAIVGLSVSNIPAPGLAAYQTTLAFDPGPIDVFNPNEAVGGSIDPFEPLGGNPFCAIIRGEALCPDPPFFLISTGRTALSLNVPTDIDNVTGNVLIGFSTTGAPAPPTGAGFIALIEVRGDVAGSTTINLQDTILATGEEPPVSIPFTGGTLQVNVGGAESPDLVVTDIRISPNALGTQHNIFVTTANLGDPLGANYNIRVDYSNGTNGDTGDVGPFTGVGEFNLGSFVISTSALPGVAVLVATADSSNDIAESNEGNNDRAEQFALFPDPSPWKSPTGPNMGAMPDITLSGQVLDGVPIMVSVTITNFGNLAITNDVVVLLTSDMGDVLDTDTNATTDRKTIVNSAADPIGIGASKSLNFGWTPHDSNNISEIRVVVDPEDLMQEASESNNLTDHTLAQPEPSVEICTLVTLNADMISDFSDADGVAGDGCDVFPQNIPVGIVGTVDGTYQLKVTNTGEDTLINVRINAPDFGLVSEPIPAACGNLNSGEVCTIFFSDPGFPALKVLDVCPAPGTVTKLATVDAEGELSGTPVSDDDPASVECVVDPHITLRKEVSLDGGPFEDANIPANSPLGSLGADAEYRLVVENDGTETLVDAVINDFTLGLVNVPVPGGPLLPGDIREITQASPGFGALLFPDRCETVGEHLNIASVEADGAFSGVPVQSEDPAYVNCEIPRIELLKQVSLDGVNFFDADLAGDPDIPVGIVGLTNATYRLIVTNLGSEVLANVLVEDAALGISAFILDLAVGETQVIESGDAGFGQLYQPMRCQGEPGNKSNIATVDAVGVNSGTSVGDDDPANVRCIVGPEILLLKQVSLNGGPFLDADSAATGPTGLLGDDANYRLIVRNVGDEDLINIKINDTTLNIVNAVVPDLPIGGEVVIEADLAGFDNLFISNRCDAVGTKLNMATVEAEGGISGVAVGDEDSANVNCEDGDTDGDGVNDDSDLCSATVIPESVPTVRLNPNHWALTEDGNGFNFDTVIMGKGKGPNRSYTIEDTAGCSCEQIIEIQELGDGHTKHGCSISAMDDWVDVVNMP